MMASSTITPITSNATLNCLVLLPNGGVLVTFQGQVVAAIFDAAGNSELPVALPEPVIRAVADGDTSAFMLGQSRQVYRFDVKTGSSDSGHAFNQTKFTSKGVNWIAGLWAQHNLQEVA